MEVSDSSWKKLAIENITKYVHRGGESKGDEPQLIGGPDFLNTIGVAMGLPTTDPERWTKSEMEKALKGELVYYDGDARKAIDVVADQIRSCCGGDDKNFITVLPIELYFDGKLYELPLFRAKRYKHSQNYYVDNAGRSYDSPRDWYKNNKLPPGEMAYPIDLILCLNDNKNAKVGFDKTPCLWLDAQAGRCVDTVAAVAGLTSSVALLFVSGGLAAPLVGTALASAGWGTGRAGYQLLDKAAHGQSVNPLASPESRLLWLGIAANLTSFGAMGATMRLSSLAARGRQVSDALRLVADVAMGTNVTVSGLAILNSTLYMIAHREDMTTVDYLMHGASIAFWTKGVFTYKTSNMIIRDARNYAFASMTKGLNDEQMSEFNVMRNRVQNDAKLLQRFHAALEANIPAKAYSQLLIDGMHYYDAVSALSPEQMDAFDGLRLYMRDDTRLIAGLNGVAARFNLNPGETLETVLNMWQHMNTQNNEGTAILKGGNLILGRAPPIKISQLQQLSPPMIRFFGEHLSQIDTAASGQWASAVPVLLRLQGCGMFTTCPVTRVVSAGRAVVSLNNHLQVSIYKLNAMTAEDCTAVLGMVSRLAPQLSGSSALPRELVSLCVAKHRLRFECHRRESVERSATVVQRHPSLLKLVESELQSFEKDRLYTFLADVEMYKADLYMKQMLEFAADMKPKTISNLVAYCEFVMARVENEMLSIKGQIANKQLSLPINTKKNVWISKLANGLAQLPLSCRFM